MRLVSLRVRNFRTFEDIFLEFHSSYTAICGANDSGKTNVVRAIRALMREDDEDELPFLNRETLSIKDDYPKWLATDHSKREISFELTITLHEQRDAGFYQFVVKQLSVPTGPESLNLTITVTHKADRAQPSVLVKCEGQEFSDLNAQEILKKLQSSKGILFHNSTQVDPRYAFRSGSIGGYIREISGQHEALVSSMKKNLNKGLSKISRRQQSEFENLLGRLQTKYKVGLSLPTFDFGYLPFNISLGERKFEVPLDDWGSGTKNRTLILLTLFRARQIGESETSASKVTPVIVVEEPESFLHPSAQAELGRVLHDLAEEFQVQVIVTTHSPYLLSMQSPQSNLLLRRKTAYKQLRDTERIDTSGEDWMAPFGQALGLDAQEFEPWKGLILSGSDSILLVEGETDKEYFQMLRDPGHGSNRLMAPGEIVSYDGTGSLKNTVLLRFVKNRYRKLFVTFDLDAADQIEKVLQSLKLEKHKDYIPIGLDLPGKKNIEGLLPESVTTLVYGTNADLVQAATAGTKDEQESAKNRLKKLLLEEFRRTSKPGQEYFGNFYPIVKKINTALS
ncbi:MAG TPA: AAA family ATPase [Candidatus Acidoferrales bacterium]|nr:AAA family ATPase [Candidatus Acidoferrales bacterium]